MKKLLINIFQCFCGIYFFLSIPILACCMVFIDSPWNIIAVTIGIFLMFVSVGACVGAACGNGGAFNQF